MPGWLVSVFRRLWDSDRATELLWDLAAALAVLLAAHAAVRFGARAIDGLFDRAGRDERLLKAGKAVTLSGLLKSVLRYGVDIGAVLVGLSIFGVPPGALFAGVGIAGLAIGFGAQNLVRDVISGFFILFEDQFHVGEYVETDGVGGIVEEMGLRVTKIRDFGGQLHIIPNGRIERVTNYSRGPMRVLFTVGIAIEEDVERAMAVMQRACDQVAAEDRRIVEGPRVLGVSSVDGLSVEVMIWAKTEPMEQWDVERKLRLRIKQALEAEGIAIAYPRQVLVPTGPPQPGAGARQAAQAGDAGAGSEGAG